MLTFIENNIDLSIVLGHFFDCIALDKVAVATAQLVSYRLVSISNDSFLLKESVHKIM